MQLYKTDKKEFSDEEILSIIRDYENTEVYRMDKLWSYYQGKNTAILSRKIASDSFTSSVKKDDSFNESRVSSNKNTPDNSVPVPYGRKIITTFTGYAFRPKYITYKPIELRQELEFELHKYSSDLKVGEIVEDESKIPVELQTKIENNRKFYVELMKNNRLNNEHIKTARAGRNLGIFGVSYELLYVDGVLDNKLNVKAEVKYITVDPREMILFYNYDSSPKKVAAIRFYPVASNKYFVEVYYSDKIVKYVRERNEDSGWTLTVDSTHTNYFGEIPVVAFYAGDEMLGLIEPVIPLIDAYDVLISDSMNEFDRFAHAYLVLKRMSLVDPLKKKEPGAFSAALANLKRFRVFENLDKDADVKFLTKDIPHEYIQFMTTLVQRQIHTQSHVPDFAGEKFTGASGIAIQRLLFDFENVCSDIEADFDVALYERMRLIATIYDKLGRAHGDFSTINISHKRNSPLNLEEYAKTATLMKQAGFSSYLIADMMPDDVVPDVEEEITRQKREKEDMFSDVESVEEDEEVDEEEPEEPTEAEKPKRNVYE